MAHVLGDNPLLEDLMFSFQPKKKKYTIEFEKYGIVGLIYKVEFDEYEVHPLMPVIEFEGCEGFESLPMGVPLSAKCKTNDDSGNVFATFEISNCNVIDGDINTKKLKVEYGSYSPLLQIPTY
jgi:hypothetical protein